ncbi:MAG TPA: TM1812 family CRISPR-associated protein [Vicinamibacterales bacterium]|nr:TM1812 family CRISPR-associated protein [Vicinamibacterales bacterium]
MSGRRVLVGSLGTGPYRRVTYVAGDRTHTTSFAPVATAVIDGGCTHAILLLTAEAEQAHGASLRAELDTLGLSPTIVSIPSGRSEREIWTIFERVVAALRGAGETEVVLDITHGFRHLPVVLFGSLAYFSAAGRVRIGRIRYGALEAAEDNRVPLLDLTPLLTMIEAHHAVRQFTETGNASRLSEILKALNKQLWTSGEGEEALSRAVNRIVDVSGALGIGLPIETGLRAEAAHRALAAVDFEKTFAPIAAEIVALLDEALRRFAVAESCEKPELALTRAELDRQLRVVQFYLRAGAYDRLLLLLREWIVNRALLASGSTAGWLQRSRRVAIERALNASIERHRMEKAIGADTGHRQDTCLALWSKVRDMRNSVAHLGMRETEVVLHREPIERLVEECLRNCADDSWWQVQPEGELDFLLVTALGLSPGVLYSAVAALSPPAALVVTSREAAPLVREACRAAAYDESHIQLYVVEDPHRCFAERARVLDWARSWLLRARRTAVNVTGGTTAMQYVVEAVGREAERLGLVVERIALVDARPPEEQRREPYVRSEVVRLEESPPEDE